LDDGRGNRSLQASAAVWQCGHAAGASSLSLRTGFGAHGREALEAYATPELLQREDFQKLRKKSVFNA
jgi:hypothetical protein